MSTILDGEELAIEYATHRRMFVIFGYGEQYCESPTYDHFMFFKANTRSQVYEYLHEYLIKTKYRELTFEIPDSFEPKQFTLKTEGWRNIKVINCDIDPLDFTNKENELADFLMAKGHKCT